MRRALLLAAVTAPVAVGALLLAGCTPLVSPPTRAHDAPFAIPQDLTWQYATTCMMQMTSGETVVSMHWGDGGVEVGFEHQTPESELDQQRVKNCLGQYRFDERADSFDYVDAFERAQLWDYYTTVTEPCLATNGVTVPRPDRTRFFLPDQRPWNLYTAMDDLPFDQLLSLYRACPPIPDYLVARHEG